MSYLYTNRSIYCHLYIHALVVPQLSHLPHARPCLASIIRFEKKKKIEKKIDIDSAMVASQWVNKRKEKEKNNKYSLSCNS